MTVVLVVLGGALYLLRVPLIGPLIRREIAAALDTALGGRHVVDAVSGSFLGDLTVTGLHTTEPGTTTEVRVLAAREVRVEFGLLELLREGLTGVHDVDIAGLDVTLQSARQVGAETPPAPLATMLREALDALPPLPPLRATGRAHWAGATETTPLAGLVLTADGGDIDVVLTDVRVPASLDLPEIPEIPELALAIRRNGSVLTVAADRPAAGVLFERATLDATPGAAALLDARIVVAGGRIEIESDGDTARAHVAEVQLARLPAWIAESLPAEVRADAGRLDADLHAPWPALVPVSGEARLTAVSLPGRPFATLSVTGRYDSPLSHLDVVVLEAAGATLRLTDVEIDPAHAWVATNVTSFDLVVPDAAGTAAAFDLDLSQVPGHGIGTSIHAVGTLSPQAIAFDQSEITGPHGSVRFHGLAVLPRSPEDLKTLGLRLHPSGEIDLGWLAEHVLREGGPDVGGVVTFSGELSGRLDDPAFDGEISGTDVTLEGRALERLVASGSFRGETVTVRRVEARGPLGYLGAHGTVDVATGRIGDADLNFETTDVAPWLALLGAPDGWSGALTLAGTASGDVQAVTETDAGLPLATELTVHGRGITAPDGPIGDVDAVIVATGARLDVRELRIVGPDGTLGGAGSWDRASGEVVLDPFDIDVRDLAVVTRLAPDVRLAGALTARGTARATIGDTLTALAISADAEARGLRVNDDDIGDVTATLRTDGENTQLTAFTAAGAWGRADGAGDVRMDSDGGTAHLTALAGEIAVDGARVPFVLEAPLSVVWTEADTSLDGLAVSAFGGRVTGALRLGERIAASLVIDGVDLAALPFDLGGATGRLTGSVAMDGARDAPHVAAVISVPDLVLEGLAGRLAARVEQPEGGALDVRDLSLMIGTTTRVTGAGRLPLRLSTAGLVSVPGATPSYELDAVAEEPAAWLARAGLDALAARRIEAHLAGDANGVRGHVAVTDLHAAGDERFAADFTGDTRIDVTADGSGVSARASAPATAPFAIAGSARISAATNWNDSAAALRALRDAPIAGDLVIDVPDIASLAPLAPAVSRAEGAVRAEIRVEGVTSDPRWRGSVASEGLSIKPEGDTPTLTDCVLRAAFDADGVVIERLDGELGYAPISVTGRLPFANGAADADLRIVGENALLVRSPYLNLRADVDLSVTGPIDALRVVGAVNVTRGLYSRPIDLVRSSPTVDDRLQLFSIRTAPLDTARLDVRFRANETLLVDNNIARGALDVDLRIRGTGAVPEPEGRVVTRDLLVILPFSRLRVEQGSVTFPPGQPFDPTIAATATSRMRGYDLRAQIDGPLDATNVHVTSSPPLAPESARLLLATGSTAEELERDGIQATALSKAGSLLGGALLSWVSGASDPDAESFADRVTVEMGREVSDTGAATIDAELMLSERWYLHGQRDRYDDVNLGLVWRVRFR